MYGPLACVSHRRLACDVAGLKKAGLGSRRWKPFVCCNLVIRKAYATAASPFRFLMYGTDIAALKLQAAREAATGRGNRLRMSRRDCRFVGLILRFVCRAETKLPGFYI